MKNGNPFWPDGKKFALCLTHDIDRVDKKWWQCIYYFIKSRNLYQIKSLFTKNKERPFWNFERIMEIEKKHGVRSTFFFLNETKKVTLYKPSTYALAFGYYKINEPRITEIMKTLESGGWEIGVHGSYDSYLDKELLFEEKKVLENILGKPIVGIRQHYLNLKIPETWELQKETGFMYDSSFGHRNKVEFRDEKVLPFLPFGDNFLEIPLAIMDGPLFKLSKDTEDAWEQCKRLIDRAEAQGALLTILWHNNRFNDKEFPGQTGIYEKIIQECQDKGAWVATGEEIYRWCMNQRLSDLSVATIR